MCHQRGGKLFHFEALSLLIGSVLVSFVKSLSRDEIIIYDIIKKKICRSTVCCCLEELYMMIRTQQQKSHSPPQRSISAMLTALSD